jgi:hypothetical protein
MWKFEGGDMYEFLSGIFDIKFIEEVTTIEEAKKLVYDNEFDDLYIKDNHIWLKVRVDMRKILGGIISKIGEDYFVVYNKFWNGNQVECVFDLDNIFSIENIEELSEVNIQSNKRKLENSLENRSKKIRTD